MVRIKKYFWTGAIFLLTPFFALAQDSGPGPSDGITLPNPLSGGDIADILNNIIDFLLIIAAPIAVIMTIWAGFLFMTAGGNQEKVITARRTLLYVIIGVAVLILSKAVISFVQSFI